VNGSTHIFQSLDALYAALQEQWHSLAQAAIADHGAFHVALAGGNTPRNFYSKLALKPDIDQQCWENTHIYFGDERCVPQQDEQSNFRMAREALFSVAPLLPQHIHAMFSADIPLQENVAKYAALLQDVMPQNASGFPIFDLVLLGMGDDGHTASLFPDTDILHETKQSVAAQFVPKLDAWRMSLTFPTINSARHVAILVAGEGKAKILAEIASSRSGKQYPIQQVDPAGQLDWYLDTDAAQLLRDGVPR
jgi:6-phosphogluconolactonase